MIDINADKPISSIEDDILGRSKIVNTLVKVISSYNHKDSLTIGLYGKWGSGKTSIINLSVEELKKLKYKIINFNPWNFKGEDDLIKCFFKDLHYQIKFRYYSRITRFFAKVFRILSLIISVGHYILPIFPFLNIIAPLIKEYGKVLENASYNKSLDAIKEKISKKLLKLDEKIVVFIDDVDRLTDIEICQIFKLVKLLGDFKNVIYILAMDKDVVLSALKNSQKDYSELYMEKIIQLPIEVPTVSPLKIQGALIDKLNMFCKDLREFLPNRNYELSKTNFWLQFNNLRDVNRYLNLFTIKFDFLKRNVDFHDFCIVTLLEIKFPKIKEFILKNKSKFTGYCSHDLDKDRKKEIKGIMENFLDKLKVDSQEKIFIKEALCFLFPKIYYALDLSSRYTLHKYEDMRIRGFICIADNFDYYYQFDDENIIYNNTDIDDIITNYKRDDFLKLINKLNEKRELFVFLTHISFYIDNNNLKDDRIKDLLYWLVEFSDNIDPEISDNDVFKYPCDKKIARMIRDYLLGNSDKIDIFSFLMKIYSRGKLNITKVYLLRSLQFSSGKVAKTGDVDEKKLILERPEVEKIESTIKNELFNYVVDTNNLIDNNYVQYYYLMKYIDDKCCKSLVDKAIKDNSMIGSFIKNFCIVGKIISEPVEKTYQYEKTINDEFDTKIMYNKLVGNIGDMLDLDIDYNLFKVCYIMCYEKGFNTEGFTRKEIEKYIKDK